MSRHVCCLQSEVPGMHFSSKGTQLPVIIGKQNLGGKPGTCHRRFGLGMECSSTFQAQLPRGSALISKGRWLNPVLERVGTRTGKKLSNLGSTWGNGPIAAQCSRKEEATPSSMCYGTSWAWQGSLLAGVLGLSASLVVSFNPGNALASTRSMPEKGSFPCEDAASYYSSAQGLQGAALKARLHELVSGHRSVTYAQVWDALKILDAVDEVQPDLSLDVQEIYTRQRVAKDLAAKPEGWNREHLWPRSYGLVLGQPEFTDLHNLRPADVNVNSSRGNKYYGECSPQGEASCLVPANREAAADTATDRLIWMPPAEVRGDIARALLYMAVRYDGEEPGSFDLELSDQPDIASGRMGLLSVLLSWHAVDPPSGSEQLRNARVCSLYQHNRNPFVDHPEYVSLIWGAGLPAGSSVMTPATAEGGPVLAGAGAVTRGRGGEAAGATAWINEFHYENAGQDQGEFVEVVVGPRADLQTLSVYLYNGKDGKVYGKIPLSSFAGGQQMDQGYRVYAKYVPAGIQNGPADGMALVLETKHPGSDKSLSEVLQFLSYEGVLTALDGPAMGSSSRDIGVREDKDTLLNSSLGLVGKGKQLQDFRWAVQSKGSSFGLENKGQEIR